MTFTFYIVALLYPWKAATSDVFTFYHLFCTWESWKCCNIEYQQWTGHRWCFSTIQQSLDAVYYLHFLDEDSEAKRCELTFSDSNIWCVLEAKASTGLEGDSQSNFWDSYFTPEIHVWPLFYFMDSPDPCVLGQVLQWQNQWAPKFWKVSLRKEPPGDAHSMSHL